MSEEKPTFKVTDRRLFNADGTPREGVRAEEPAATINTTVATPIETPAAGVATNATETAPREQSREASTPPLSSAETSTTGARRSSTAEEMESDATAFANLIMFIASPAAAAMGMTEHPGMGPQDIDLPLAKHCIDLLGTVQQKARGNLSMQEEQMLEGLLTELRMQYVSMTSTRTSSAPRGFTGSDITGGR